MNVRYEFRAALRRAARSFLGTKETARNSGPEIDAWLEYVHAKPGDPWCPAFVSFMHRCAAVLLDVPNTCPRTDSVHRMWELTPPQCRVAIPYPGCTYFIEHSPTSGHTGIVDIVSPGGTVMSEISGNTNGAGSREGNQVAEHHGPPELSHGGKLLGFADYAELIAPGLGELPPSPFAA